MNTREAKETLLLYRGSIDDSDPQFREALSHAQGDPELAQWLQEQTRCYDAIQAKLRDVEPRSIYLRRLFALGRSPLVESGMKF
jgi:hypothetical protein